MTWTLEARDGDGRVPGLAPGEAHADAGRIGGQGGRYQRRPLERFEWAEALLPLAISRTARDEEGARRILARLQDLRASLTDPGPALDTFETEKRLELGDYPPPRSCSCGLSARNRRLVGGYADLAHSGTIPSRSREEVRPPFGLADPSGREDIRLLSKPLRLLIRAGVKIL